MLLKGSSCHIVDVFRGRLDRSWRWGSEVQTIRVAPGGGELRVTALHLQEMLTTTFRESKREREHVR